MLLTIDIGNTNATLGVYDGKHLLADWRLTSAQQMSRDELGLALVGLFHHAGIHINSLDGVCLASVVPPLTSTYVGACQRYLDQTPLVVDMGVKTGVKVLVSEPRTVGADRIVNACAVKALVGGPAVVVDFGTATTFDAIDHDDTTRAYNEVDHLIETVRLSKKGGSGARTKHATRAAD